jgi:hypothetical protein
VISSESLRQTVPLPPLWTSATRNSTFPFFDVPRDGAMLQVSSSYLWTHSPIPTWVYFYFYPSCELFSTLSSEIWAVCAVLQFVLHFFRWLFSLRCTISKWDSGPFYSIHSRCFNSLTAEASKSPDSRWCWSLGRQQPGQPPVMDWLPITETSTLRRQLTGQAHCYMTRGCATLRSIPPDAMFFGFWFVNQDCSTLRFSAIKLT